MAVVRDTPEPTPRPGTSRKTKLVMGLLSVAVLASCAEQSATEPSPGARLVEAGWSFGFCLGPCTGVLSVDGGALSYRVTDRQGEEVIAQSQGELTSSGSARLSTLLGALPGSLRDRYGCPDCADGGAAWVVVDRGAGGQRSEYEYPSPPAELAPLDAFLREVMEALGDCRSTGTVGVAAGCVALVR